MKEKIKDCGFLEESSFISFVKCTAYDLDVLESKDIKPAEIIKHYLKPLRDDIDQAITEYDKSLRQKA